MPIWLIKLFHSLGRKSAAKRTGIAKIPTSIEAEGHGAALYTQLREAGFTDEALTKLIKSEKDIIRLVNKVESMQKQQTKGIKSLKTKEPTTESLLKGEKYTDERGRTWDFGTKDRPFPGANLKVVPKETEAQIKARMIKENRSNVQKSYLRQLDKRIMEEMDITAKEMENMSSTALDDLRRNADPVGMRKQFDEITEGRGVGDFPDDPLKEPDYASGGIARVGYSKGKLAKWLLSLGKKPKPKINRKLTKDELDDLYEEFDEAVPYPMETVGDKEKFLKAVKDEEAYMFQQYKKGNLDPKPGEPNRKRFLEKKLEEMELSGDKRLMTRDEIEELSSFDLGTEMDEAIKKSKTLTPEEELRREFPGIDDRLIKNILADTNPQRIAEVKQTMREALKMQEKGMSPDEIIKLFKDTTRTKQAYGGIAGELHLNDGGRARFANGSPHTYDTGGWKLVNPDKELREFTPEEIEQQRELMREWLKKRKTLQNSLAVSKELPEELPPFQGPPYETDNPKEAGKEIIRRIIGGGHNNPPIGGGFAFDVPYGAGKPYDYGIQYSPDGSDFLTYYGIQEDGDNVYGGGYQGKNFGAGVTKKEGAEPQFTFGFKKKLKKKPKYIFQAKGGLAKILGV